MGLDLRLGEWQAATLVAKVAWAKVEYLGIVSVPPLWLLFTLAYSRQAGVSFTAGWLCCG